MGISRKKQAKDKQWGRRVQAGIDWREDYEAEWKRNRRLLLGNVRPRNEKQDISSKLGWAAFQTMIGAIYAQNPTPVVREKSAELANAAKQLTQIVTQDFEEMNLREATRKASQDVFWAGFGLIMERYDAKIEEDADGVPHPTKQQWSLQRVHPMSVIVDPRCVSPDMVDAQWAAVEWYPSIAQLKADDDIEIDKETLDELPRIYGSPNIDDAKSRARKKTKDVKEDGDDEDPDYTLVRCVEVYDKVAKKVRYMVPGSDVYLGEKDWPIEVYGRGDLLFPWVTLYFNENPDEFYPIPEMSMISEEIDMYTILRRQMLMDVTTKFRKFIVRGDMLQKGQVDKLVSGKPWSVVLTGNGLRQDTRLPLNDVVAPIPDTAIKQDVASAMQTIKNEVHETIGAGDFAAAGFRNTRSATEAAALSDFLASRMRTRTENLDAFFKKLTRLHVGILQETATEKRYVKITDVSGIDTWEKFDKDAIQGDFDFNIVAGSSAPKNTESAKQANTALLQQMLPIVMQNGGDVQPLFEWIAPFYELPQHVIEGLFKGAKSALKDVAMAIAAKQSGKPIPPEVFLELVSRSVNRGLSPADLAQVAQQVAPQGGQPGNRNAEKKRQPAGLPGTNTTDQSL